MFTSRAEYRLLLREDNADQRLSEIGHEMGLVAEEQWRACNQKQEAVARESQRLHDTWIHPGKVSQLEVDTVLDGVLSKEARLEDLLRRPDMNYQKLVQLETAQPGVDDPTIAAQVEIEVKYAGYIARQQEDIARASKNESTLIPLDLDYQEVSGLSNEVAQKFTDHRPGTIGQASRIPGVTPAAISIMLIHLKKQRHKACA